MPLYEQILDKLSNLPALHCLKRQNKIFFHSFLYIFLAKSLLKFQVPIFYCQFNFHLGELCWKLRAKESSPAAHLDCHLPRRNSECRGCSKKNFAYSRCSFFHSFLIKLQFLMLQSLNFSFYLLLLLFSLLLEIFWPYVNFLLLYFSALPLPSDIKLCHILFYLKMDHLIEFIIVLPELNAAFFFKYMSYYNFFI